MLQLQEENEKLKYRIKILVAALMKAEQNSQSNNVVVSSLPLGQDSLNDFLWSVEYLHS